MKKLKQNIIYVLFICMILLVLIFLNRSRIKRFVKHCLGITKNQEVGSGSCPNCITLFTDDVATQAKAYANGSGIKPQKDESGLELLCKKKILIKISTNNYYIVDDMNFSKPVVLPKCKIFIDDLVNLYKSKCEKNRIKYESFTISSATRSLKSVKKLKAKNNNAIKNSGHLKGKTFDVSYRAFNNNFKQTKLFIESLKELKQLKRCFVKYEKNGCLHITVN